MLRARVLFLSVASLALVALVAPRQATAEIYDVPILVDSEDDLLDLREQGDIDEEQYERLLHLLERPLDLNRSRRDALYDLPGMTYPMIDELIVYRGEVKLRDVDDLEDAGIPSDVVEQVRPFVKVARRLARPPAVEGSVRLRGIEEFEDGKNPGFYLQARTRVANSVDIGFAGLLQDRIGPFTHHHRDGLTWVEAEKKSIAFQLPKFYVTMEEPGWAFIVGSYQVGFGEKLVFDETSRIEPNGFYVDDVLSEYEESGKFGVRERMYGFAASLKDLSLGEDAGAIDATVFFSYWPYDVSQNDVDSGLRNFDDSIYRSGSSYSNPLFLDSSLDPFVVGRKDCSSAELEAERRAALEMCEPQCPGTDVEALIADNGVNGAMGQCLEACAYEIASSDPSGCAARGDGKYSHTNLRAAFTEMLAGAHIAYLPTPQWQIGVTGYYAKVDWLEGGDDLFFTPSARFPNRDWYGAVGLDLQGQVGPVSLFGEYAYTFEAGHAAVLRSVFGWKNYDIEVSGRYYGEDFDNPHARGTAASDEFEGQRDRDEAGARLRFNARPLKWLRMRIDLDMWHRMSLDTWNTKLTTRFDFRATDWLKVSVGLDLTDKDLAEGGRTTDYLDGDGMRLAAWGQIQADPLDNLLLTLFYKSAFLDKTLSEPNEPTVPTAPGDDATDEERDLYQAELAEYEAKHDEWEDDFGRWSHYQDNFQHDHYAWFLVRYKPLDFLTLSARAKYYDESSKYSTRDETYVEGWFQVNWRIIDSVSFLLRYRLRSYIDDRERTTLTQVIEDDGVSFYTSSAGGETIHLLKGTVDVRF